MWLGGCAPEPVSTWMLGTFTSDQQTLDDDGNFSMYEFHDDGTVDVIHYSYGKKSDTIYVRAWVRQGDDAVYMHAAENENQDRDWTFERQGPCGPFFHDTVYPDRPDVPDDGPGGQYYRGKICPRFNPDPCSGCGGVILEWCDGNPPPCDADGENSDEADD
jgi:hypothetical protein